MAFDFVEDTNKDPLIIEMSYGFGTAGIDNAPGYWDSSLQWHDEKINPQGWMVEEIISNLNI